MPRPLLTGCAATAIAASVLALSGLALSGSAAASVATARQPGGAPPVSLAITSVSPAFAKPGQTVTVSGTLTNSSTAQMTGLSVQLRSSSTPFDNRTELQEYADGTAPADSPVPGAVTAVPGTIAPRATVDWSVALRASQMPMTAFGVYPLAAQADSSSLAPLTVSRTFLPFWPGRKALDPKRQEIAWIWPLIDAPRQGVCAGLLNNGLAASLRSGGRLDGLLAAGSEFASRAHLTWAVDPALLANVTTMTAPYQAGGNAGCHGATKSASQAAIAWLARLKAATAGQPVFVTPYADADIAALTRFDLNDDLTRAFTEGRAVAGKILGRDFRTTPADADPSLNGMAWPADGIANYAVLENLAASDGINTVVLDSSTMPPSPPQTFTPSAQTTTPDGEGPVLNVLLSDDTITQVIASANSASDSKATAFAVAQRYLAETAMIAAELPGLARSIVVAPPRRWNPPAGLARDLLQETVSAPWLQPVSLSQLAATKNPTGQVSRQVPRAVSSAELRRSMLNRVRHLDQQVRLLQSIQVGSDPSLEYGMAALESSAWRGGGAAGRQGSALAHQISEYLSGQYGKVTIIAQGRFTLAGLTGTVPVSISNQLGYPVKVGLHVASNPGITVKRQQAVIVPAGQQEIIKLGVKATTVGSTTLRLSLVSSDGVPIPGAQANMTVQATHYGTLALVIIAAALGVFLLSSATRAVRRSRRAGGAGQDRKTGQEEQAGQEERNGQEEPDGTEEAGSTDPADAPAGSQNASRQVPQDAAPVAQDAAPAPQDRAADLPYWHAEPGRADSVVPGHHDTGHAGQHDPAEETDDYAWAPRWADRR